MLHKSFPDLPAASWTSVTTLRPAMDSLARRVTAPALVVDGGRWRQLLTAMADDVPALANAWRCVAWQSGMPVGLLQVPASARAALAVATPAEAALALEAGVPFVLARGRAWSAPQMAAWVASGVLPNLTSISQIERWGEASQLPRQIGLQWHPWAGGGGEAGPSTTIGAGYSRVGLDDVLTRHGLEIVQLQVCCVGWLDAVDRQPEAVSARLDTLIGMVDRLQGLKRLILTGDWLRWAADTAATHPEVTERLAEAAAGWEAAGVDVVLQDGLAIWQGSSVLVGPVIAVDDVSDERRVVVVDVPAGLRSAQVLAVRPERLGEVGGHWLASQRETEPGWLATDVAMTRLKAGDLLVLAGRHLGDGVVPGSDGSAVWLSEGDTLVSLSGNAEPADGEAG
jgi:diaminopimelate decarboxylase